MKSEKKARPTKAIAIYDDVFSAFKTEKFEIQKEINEPDLSANDALDLLIKNSRELRELKKQGLAKE
jgi:hypothetical protein